MQGGDFRWRSQSVLCSKRGSRKLVESASAGEPLMAILDVAINNSCGETEVVRVEARGRLITAFADVGTR